MARGGARPGAGRKPKAQPPSPDEVKAAADRAEGLPPQDDDYRGGLGRPSAYQPLFARQAAKLITNGATDADLASFFEVSIRTIYRWKHDHDDFCQALKRAKEIADDVVEESLFRRATGYSHDAVKIMQYEGAPVVVPFVEHYPPDTAAAFIWLKNRRPDRWRDKPAGTSEDAADIARQIDEARTAMKQVEGRDS